MQSSASYVFPSKFFLVLNPSKARTGMVSLQWEIKFVCTYCKFDQREREREREISYISKIKFIFDFQHKIFYAHTAWKKPGNKHVYNYFGTARPIVKPVYVCKKMFFQSFRYFVLGYIFIHIALFRDFYSFHVQQNQSVFIF